MIFDLYKSALCLACLIGYTPFHVRAATIECTATHCVPDWGLLGIIELKIDSVRSGPFDIILENPDGTRDTMADFRAYAYTYRNLQAGNYCITVKCCATCEAYLCLEIEKYQPVLVGETPVFLTKKNILPGMDAATALLACSDVQEEEDVWCEATFTLYAAVDFSDAARQTMLEKAILSIRQVRSAGHGEDEEKYPDHFPEVRPEEPFKALVWFDEQGAVWWAEVGW